MSWPSADHLARGRGDDAADDVDQRGLARAVRAQQGEDLALVDIQCGALQGLYAGGVGLGQVLDRDDGRHAAGK